MKLRLGIDDDRFIHARVVAAARGPTAAWRRALVSHGCDVFSVAPAAAAAAAAEKVCVMHAIRFMCMWDPSIRYGYYRNVQQVNTNRVPESLLSNVEIARERSSIFGVFLGLIFFVFSYFLDNLQTG